ncbi:unnamed protein product [Allacma fusca]|uniref:Ion transport domain-containing protein n=1 Tax=Allacma fusca TaxID=39272 RepID=A0A8J2NZL0_9HEXA|nr:unnamed protein product [Allacma fusca]
MGRSFCLSESSVEVESAGPNSINNETDNKATSGHTKGLCFLEESPLRILRVAERGNVKEFTQLISRDPSLLMVCDNKGRTAVHQAALKDRTAILKVIHEYKQSFDTLDEDGCSPLHIAVRSEALDSIGFLLEKFGRSKIIQLIMQDDHSSTLLNDNNNNGWTPVHVAAREGHHRVLEILMKKGAFLRKDYQGRTPLHLAAENGHKDVISLILNTHSHLIDLVDKYGNTPLHSAAIHDKYKVVELLLRLNCQLIYNHDGCSAIDLALMNKFAEVAYVMVTHKNRGDEILGLTSGRHRCIMDTLIAKMPAVAKAVLDIGIKKSANEKPDSPAYFVEYNFKWLTHPGGFKGKDNKYLPILNEMVTYDRVGLLSHELTLKYLEMKWNAYGKFFQYTNLVFYLLFLSMVTIYTTHEEGRDFDFFSRWKWFNEPVNKSEGVGPSCPGPELIDISLFEDDKLETSYSYYRSRHSHVGLEIFYITCIGNAVLTCFNLFVEIISVYRYRIKYFENLDTWVWIIMNMSCFYATVVPLINIFVVAEDTEAVTELDNPSLAVAVFMGWFYLLLIMQRFDAVGLYVSMFLEILKTLFRVLIIFSVLIVAFAMAFYVLLSNGNHIAFSDIPMAMMRTFSMMLGDLDFMNTFLYPYHCDKMEKSKQTNTRMYTTVSECAYPRRIPHPYATFPMVCVYMVFMPIVMINLLIGLAVGDIELVRNNAKLKRLSMQVQSHTNMEKIMPNCLLRKVDKTSVVEYPNAKKGLGIIERIVKFFKQEEKMEDFDEMNIESDDLMEAILENSVALGKLTSDMDSVTRLVQLICTKLNINSEINADDGAPTYEINLMPEIRNGLHKNPLKKSQRRKLVRSDSSQSIN